MLTQSIRKNVEEDAPHVHLRGRLPSGRAVLVLVIATDRIRRRRCKSLVVLIVVCGHEGVDGGQLALVSMAAVAVAVAPASMAVPVAMLCWRK